MRFRKGRGHSGGCNRIGPLYGHVERQGADLDVRDCIRLVLVWAVLLAVTGCVPVRDGESAAEIVFRQDDKVMKGEHAGGVATFALANRPFDIVLPASVSRVQICAAANAGIFGQVARKPAPCFAPGTGMAVTREEETGGWLLRLTPQGTAHNYFDESRMAVEAGGRVIHVKGFAPHSAVDRFAQTIYLLVFVDANGNRVADLGEMQRMIVRLDSPVGGETVEKRVTDPMRDFAAMMERIATDYIRPRSRDRLIDDAIAGFSAEAGIRPPPRVAPTEAVADQGRYTPAQLGRLTAAYKAAAEKLPADEGDRLFLAGIRRVLQGLDEHSAYLSPKELGLKPANGVPSGNIGLMVSRHGGKWIATFAVPDSPAAGAGFQAGDRVVAVDDVPTAGMRLHEITQAMEGAPGTSVKLVALRNGSRQTYTLTRTVIHWPDAECRVLNDHIIYLRPYRMTMSVAQRIEKSAQALRTAMAGNEPRVVLDLRGNTGGLLQSSVRLADLFLEHGRIVTLQGRIAKGDTVFNANSRAAPFAGWRTIVLVDAGTSSGAEAVAAALQDNHRATLIGERTLGAGTVQSIFPLLSGALKLTTYRMVRPSGAPIGDGVVPDVARSEIAAAQAASARSERSCPGFAAPPRTLAQDTVLGYALGL